MMRRARGTPGKLAAIALVALLIAGACGGDDDEEATGNTRDRDEETTTTAESTTTTVAAVGPPEWVEVARDVQVRLDDLYMEPDLEKVPQVVAEECDCYQRHFDNIAAIVDEGQRIVGEPTRVLFVKVEREYPAKEARLTVKVEVSEAEFVDADGNVLQELPAESRCASLLLTPDGVDGSYRIHDELQVGCPPEAES